MPRTCPDCGWVWPKPSGPCPHCGSETAPPIDVATLSRDETPVKMPWHLKLFVVALAIYLAWRLVQGVVWLAHHL